MSEKPHLMHVVGARPNFMKLAPVHRAIAQLEFARQTIVHTGQHYDVNMSDVFFEQLSIPEPDFHLAVGSASHAKQTAEIMVRFEAVIEKERPRVVIVYGDVNSTVAAALVCAKLGIEVAHVEAGLRSFDREMPEEINRLVTDQLATLLFTPSSEGDGNLAREGIAAERVHLVGNVMIDTLVRLLPAAALPSGVPERYALVTLHRPSNVDDDEQLRAIVAALSEIADRLPVVFPVHPRTRERLARLAIELPRGIVVTGPKSYLEFLALQKNASVVITDSGGIQEETTYLGVPCLTMRENTERPITITQGMNTLVGRDTRKLSEELERILRGQAKHGRVPALWDGRAGERIAALLATHCGVDTVVGAAREA